MPSAAKPLAQGKRSGAAPLGTDASGDTAAEIRVPAYRPNGTSSPLRRSPRLAGGGGRPESPSAASVVHALRSFVPWCGDVPFVAFRSALAEGKDYVARGGGGGRVPLAQLSAHELEALRQRFTDHPSDEPFHVIVTPQAIEMREGPCPAPHRADTVDDALWARFEAQDAAFESARASARAAETAAAAASTASNAAAVARLEASYKGMRANYSVMAKLAAKARSTRLQDLLARLMAQLERTRDHIVLLRDGAAALAARRAERATR